MKPLLIIDAGHGGKDPGGGSCEFFTEAAMNLMISLYQFKRCQELGIPTILTRDKDIYLGAKSRSRLVRDSGAKYCISNHINSAPDKNARGAETIHSLYADGKLAIAIMNELVNEGIPRRRVFFRVNKKRSTKDYYYMHRLTGSVETIIVEYGFATNDSDKKKIYVFWATYAEAALRGFCLHAGLDYSFKHNLKPTQDIPTHKLEGINYLYESGFLTDESWREKFDEPLPMWAIGLIMKRAFNKKGD